MGLFVRKYVKHFLFFPFISNQLISWFDDDGGIYVARILDPYFWVFKKVLLAIRHDSIQTSLSPFKIPKTRVTNGLRGTTMCSHGKRSTKKRNFVVGVSIVFWEIRYQIRDICGKKPYEFKSCFYRAKSVRQIIGLINWLSRCISDSAV